MRVWLAWSSGKDSAWAYERLKREGGVEVAALLTTFNSAFDRVAMHAVRRRLARAQALALGLPLEEIDLPWPCPNEEYERLMAAACARARASGVEAIAFGDLFLEDVRAYRERNLAAAGMGAVFPLWGLPTRELAREMVEGGLKAMVTCVDPRRLDASFAGRRYDPAFLDALPPEVDPCGENGEFHTFVSDAPSFRSPIEVEPGEVVERDGFVFADVRPV